MELSPAAIILSLFKMRHSESQGKSNGNATQAARMCRKFFSSLFQEKGTPVAPEGPLTANGAVYRFQLVGIACLRAAMLDSRTKGPEEGQSVGTAAKLLDPQRFAYISDRTYTSSEVEELSLHIDRETPDFVRTAPNAKMFLRSFWYRAVTEHFLHSEEMHLYTIARFVALFCRPE